MLKFQINKAEEYNYINKTKDKLRKKVQQNLDKERGLGEEGKKEN